MRTLLAVLILLAVSFAGCADEASPAPEAEQTEADKELEATETTGVIRGVVVDEAINPIEGAKIVIASSGVETMSLADGSFGFSDLEPGIYNLDVSKIGFATLRVQANVEAGVDKPEVVRAQITPDPTSAPSYQSLVFKGHLRCAGAAFVIAFPCSVIRGTEDTVEDYNGFTLDFELLPDFFQAELQWTNTQPAGETLLLDLRHCCDNDSFGANGTQRGPSPLIANVVKHEMEAAAILADGMEISVFGSGLEGTDVVGYGLGAQVEQSFTIFHTQTYNFRPVEGWTFIYDGEPVPPS